MRTITPPSRCQRLRSSHGRVDRLPTVVVLAVMSVTAACGDTMIMNPVAPTPPALGVSGDGTWMVNSLADPGDGVCTNNECTLREAISAAQGGEHVVFKSNLSGTIALTAGELVIAKGLVIDGPGADRIAVSGQDLHTVLSIGVGPAVTISGLTVTRGHGEPLHGGGISIEDGGSLTLIGAVVTRNSAGTGAGILASGPLTLVGSTVAANVALGIGGGIYAFSELTVRRSTISGNTANQGAGIHVACSDCPAAIASSTITSNVAGSVGGGVSIFATAFTVFNTIIAGNRAHDLLTDPEADCYGVNGTASLGYNLSGMNTGCGLVGSTDILVAPSQVFTSVLSPFLAANGSPRLTHALIERGYAVDAGYCPGESGDQRGFARPYDDPRMPNALDACDIGAFEWQPADTKSKGPKP